MTLIIFDGARGGAVGRGPALQAAKVAEGFITDGVTENFHWPNPSSRNMALDSTQHQTEMSTRDISWGLRRPMRRDDNLKIPGASTCSPTGLPRLVQG